MTLPQNQGMNHTPSDHWNHYFREIHLSGADLDWGEQWTGAFIKPLHQANIDTILDLGCGTGNDVLRLTQAGFKATGFDYSKEAIYQARSKAGPKATFLVADMAQTLPFSVSSFDAVMSNVAMHMFPDAITRAIFFEIRRIVRPEGLFLFHVNSVADRPLRAKRKPPVRELEADFILEQNGQTMHFFSKEYLLELLADWHVMSLEAITILDRETGDPFKRVWRGIVRR